MISHSGNNNWSESLLHRFRGSRVVVVAADAAAASLDTTISGNNSNNSDPNNSSSSSSSHNSTNHHHKNNHITTTIDLKKGSMGTDGGGKTPLSIHYHHESLPFIDEETSSKDRSSIHRQIIRDVRARWNRLTVSTRRIICLFVLPLLACYWTIDVMDALFPVYGALPPPQHQPVAGNVAATNEFVVVINTYQRPAQLRDAVRHYAETCGPAIGINTVYIVWAEEGVTPPTLDDFFPPPDHHHRRRREAPLRRSTIQIISVRNSLNSRFLPISNIQKNMAVFMVDDDIRVDCRSLQRGFEAWTVHPASMVGYYPRLALLEDHHDRHSGRNSIRTSPPTAFIYHSWPVVYWRQQMNFILTKACFLHSRYMSIYSDPNQHPIEILNYIDKYFNCEDVAMSLLVANITKSATTNPGGVVPARPIYVEGQVRDKGLFNGISTGSGHMTQRSKCLMDLTEIYQRHGWVIPLEVTFSLRESSWRRHLFGWQSQPSNVYEWFALSNIFK